MVITLRRDASHGNYFTARWITWQLLYVVVHHMVITLQRGVSHGNYFTAWSITWQITRLQCNKDQEISFMDEIFRGKQLFNGKHDAI